jgi:outer membrane protein assembly factor BamB
MSRIASRLSPIGIVLVAVMQLPADQPPGDWPQWRGPRRDNRSSDTGLLKTWPDGGPPLEWRVDGLGEGIDSVAVADGRVLTLGQIGGVEYLQALEAQSGRRLWAGPTGSAIGAVHRSPLMRWLSQRTPTLDDDRVYVVRSDGQLICMATHDGGELWRKNVIREFRAPSRPWGFCDYPLVDGDHLICTPGGEDATIVALDKRTGEIRWKSKLEGDQWQEYGALVVAEFGGVRQYLAFLHSGLVSVSASDGRLLWQHNVHANRTANSYTPLVLFDQILQANGYGSGLALLNVHHQDGAFQVEEVYQKSYSFEIFEDSTAVVGDELYGSLRTGVLTCFNWATGDVHWSDRATRRGMLALTFADNRLYLLHADGYVTLVEPDASACAVRGAFLLPDHVKSAGATFPVVTGGRLYLRNDDHLFCYDVREDRGSDAEKAPTTIALAPPAAPPDADRQAPRVPRPIFVPTPQDVVEEMLKLANVEKDDLLVDLGSGDGRIVITAAKKYGCRAIGYEIDKELIGISNEQVQSAEVGKLVTIREQDMYTADLSEVDVVAVYAYSAVLDKLKPQFAKLKPGSRIVSHFFEIPGVEPADVQEIESAETGGKHRILLYRTPLSTPDR